jgi:hypothetical protein
MRTRLSPASHAVAALLLAAAPAAARAQLTQIALALNENGYGEEYVTVAVEGGLEGNAAYTIEAWVHPTSYGIFPTIVGNDFTLSYWLGLSGSGQVRFYPRGGPGQFVETSATVPLDTWTHVAATYSSASGYAIYLNGELALSGATITGAVGTNPADLRIGADRTAAGPAYFWHGYLDEIRVWSRARTGAEVRSTMYTAVGRRNYFSSGAYAGLQANWGIEGTAIASFNDAADEDVSLINRGWFINGNKDSHTTDGTPFGAPVAPNAALQLNGVDDRAVVPVSEAFANGVTISAWIAPASFSGFPTIVSRNYQESFWLGLTPSGRLRFYPTGGGFVDGNRVLPLDRWTHVAATYGYGKTVLYVNGEADRISWDFAGPVGANGRDVWIGANPGTLGPNYPFAGYVDDVRIAQGPLDREEILRSMYSGALHYADPTAEYDEQRNLVGYYHVEFDWQERFEVLGSGAKIVRSGAPVVISSEIRGYDLHHFGTSIFGGVTVPDDDFSSLLSVPLTWTVPGPIVDVDVFVSSAITDLAATRVRLRSPAGTWVDLISPGAASGRDLLTVFDDAADHTLATSFPPFSDGVRPSQVLAGFHGEEAAGVWQIELSASGGGRVGLWTWGLRINGAVLAADTPRGLGAGLRLDGPNPVRGAGALAFDLPSPAVVDLALFDAQGRRVRQLASGRMQSGAYRAAFASEGIAAGVYFARLRVDGAAHGTAKVAVVK